MILTDDNYFSTEASKEYFSVSQFKEFMKCEVSAMASINGEYQRPMTRALLVGSFVDAYFEGRLKQFQEEHPEVFTQKNELRADFKKANEIIARVKTDPLFMKFMSGEKQRILTFELFGVKWKMKMDSYLPGVCITDLKVVANFKYMHNWRYDIQGAIYQKGVEISEGELLPFYLAAATKEKVTNLDIFQIPQVVLDNALEEVEFHIERFKDIKLGQLDAIGCGTCNYCKSIKKATVRNYSELLEG